MNLILYYAPTTCALVPHVTLLEGGADFEVRTVTFAKGQHRSPQFLEGNPKHKVPVLLIDGRPLTENVAIQIWIARNFPKAQLLPRDPIGEIEAIAFLAWCASSIHIAITPCVFPQWFCDMPGSEASVKRLSHQRLA